MNENHARVCTSPEWADYLRTEILSVLTRDVDLGKEMLEIGPGPGAATEWLRHKVARLTAVEIDQAAAATLAERYADTNVEIVVGSGADLQWPADSFDSAGCFTMLHHVPTTALQNQILAEALRVLRPGGVLIGSDSLASTGLHDFHEGDTYNPVEPAALLARLQTLGYGKITISVDHAVKFIAHKPVPGEDEEED
ncbi:MAG TPA: class I SAM-dependent methyltransferase [Streptosporangiaceae bacterium]|nr:class I SAM-dependent methyltransferase [Streptosporangiaceae bacterium]